MTSRARPKVMTLTEAAAQRVKQIMASSGNDVIGLRVGIKRGGCAGMEYTMEYATGLQQHEEVVEDKGVKILIDPAATMFLIGTEMDFVDDKLQSGFVFKNPNEKARCGCGESFSV